MKKKSVAQALAEEHAANYRRLIAIHSQLVQAVIAGTADEFLDQMIGPSWRARRPAPPKAGFHWDWVFLGMIVGMVTLVLWYLWGWYVVNNA